MLCRLLAEEPKEDVLAAVEALQADYENRPGLQIVEVAGGYQIVTRPELHEWVRRLFHERSTQKLTVPGLETLAVIAYKQPITALEIGEIRGVNTSGVLSTLLERHLIKIVGRKNVVGRPFLYATTKEFLIRFGLKDLNDLPKIEDMAEALGFDPPAGLIEQTPREDVLPLDEGDVEGEPSEDELARACSVLTSAPVSSRHSPGWQPSIRSAGRCRVRVSVAHRVADRLAHPAHLAVAPFSNRQPQRRVRGRRGRRSSALASAGSVRGRRAGCPSRRRRSAASSGMPATCAS